jgi:hypothetical protein
MVAYLAVQLCAGELIGDAVALLRRKSPVAETQAQEGAAETT